MVTGVMIRALFFQSRSFVFNSGLIMWFMMMMMIIIIIIITIIISDSNGLQQQALTSL